MSVNEVKLGTQLDKLAIAELAQAERAARDERDWDRLFDSYHRDSRVYISWFEGTATEFVEASRQMTAQPGGGSIHQLGVTLVTLNGDRALADTGCAILMRRNFEGVECDVTAYCRHRSRVERRDGVWRLLTLVGVYQKDTLVPAVPGEIPQLDLDRLHSFRPSYRYLSYYRAQMGHRPHMDRPGVDRPELIERLVREDESWLAGAS